MIRRCKQCGNYFFSFIHKRALCKNCSFFMEKLLQKIPYRHKSLFDGCENSDLRKYEMDLLEKRIDEIIIGYTDELY